MKHLLTPVASHYKEKLPFPSKRMNTKSQVKTPEFGSDIKTHWISFTVEYIVEKLK
jgi:hypothetical protein